jgi:alkaline phosphatase D
VRRDGRPAAAPYVDRVPDLPRRRFLAGLGAAAAAPALPALHRAALAAPAQPDAAPFDWGVASFDPTPDSVLLWTRLDPAAGGDGPSALRWTLARDEGLTDAVATGEVLASPATGHCATAVVDGLDDGRWWFFAFTAPDGRRSAVGRTRTLPRAGQHLRLAVASCARFADGGFAAYRAIAERDVDVVVHVGDYVYTDGFAGERPHDPPHRVVTLADYRTRYAQHRADPDLQALHARHPMVTAWDDHDVAGNAWRDGAALHDADDGPWADRVAAATQAHEEWVPGRTARAEDGRLRAWRHLDLGDLAELVVLDTRLWGRDRAPRDPEELAADGRSMLGEDQAAFVAERLGRDDRPPWLLLLNQVMLHPLRLPVPSSSLAEQVRDAGFIVTGGAAVNPDQWDGYPAAREQLLRAIGGRGGVVALTGDVHSSWAWEGPANDGGEPTMVELVTPSITSDTFAERIPVPAELVELGLRTVERDLAHVELSSHGFLLVDLTPDEVVAEWWHVDPDVAGSQQFRTARSAPLEPPMRLTEVFEPTPDRGQEELAPPGGAAPGPASGNRDDDDGPPWPAVAAGGAFAAGALAAAIAVRTRTRR